MFGKILILSGAAALLPVADTISTGGAGDAAAMQRDGSAWNRQLSFTLEPDEGGPIDRVQLSLRHGDGNRRSHYGRSFARSDLEGLGTADGPVRFRIAREAGTIDCSGTMRDQRGSGECRFTPDAGFAAELDRRGIGRPDAEEQFHLAMAGVGRPLLAELERQSYPRPRIRDLVALGIHGADVDYLRGLDQAGYRVGSLERLVEFRIHGVTPAYIAELSALGGEFRNMAPERLTEMRIHGVTPAFARAMSELGYRGLGPSQLVGMRIHGVTEARVRELAAIGYRDLSSDALTQFAIHGVTPAYIREMAQAGYADLTPAQLVNLRIHGVRADDAAAINAAVSARD
jgi:hypothetical protein